MLKENQALHTHTCVTKVFELLSSLSSWLVQVLISRCRDRRGQFLRILSISRPTGSLHTDGLADQSGSELES